MHKVYIPLLCLFMANTASAQQFVSGSFEPTVAVNACNTVSNATFNYEMSGAANAFGTLANTAYDGIYFNDSACHDTTAKLGYYSLAMDWASSGYTAIALKVSPAMQAGHSYTGSFWYSASLYFSSCNFQIGYSADSSTFGTLINSYYAPGIFVINWQQGTFTFTPSVTCKWITIQTTASTQNNSMSPYMYTLLDAFSLSSTSSVNEVESNNDAIRIVPNPANNAAYITFNNTVFQNDVDVTITDMAGRSI